MFSWLAKTGGVEAKEMLRTFNCGVGMIAVVAAENVAKVSSALEAEGETVYHARPHDRPRRRRCRHGLQGHACHMSSPRKRAVVFISGSGSNMMALVAAAKAADYPAEIVGVISDKADAGGLAKAAAEGIATFAFPRKDYASKDAHEAAIFSALDELTPDISAWPATCGC